MGTTENVQAWSTTAATNANADTAINWAEGQDAASVNNSARSMMAAIAKHVDDIGGLLAAGGTANALTVTTNQVLSSAHITPGLRLLVLAANANTSSVVTFAPDGLSPVPIKRADGSALAVGSIVAGLWLDLVCFGAGIEWRAVNIPSNAGVIDASSPAAGQIGEFLSAAQAGAPISNGAPATFVSLSLSAGDWEVWGTGATLGGATACSAFVVGLSVATNVFSGFTTASMVFTSAVIAGGTSLNTAVGRVIISTPTTIYLVLQANFTPGSVNCSATLYARRLR